MTITNTQINKLESLILRGIVTLKSLPQEKKNYIEEVKTVINDFCQENGDPIPDWLSLALPPIFVGDDRKTTQAANDFYHYFLPHLIDSLRELQSQFYKRMQLNESRMQTEEARKQSIEAKEQTEETKKHTKLLRTSIVISIVAVFISFMAAFFSFSSHNIKIDNDQLGRIINVLSMKNDSTKDTSDNK